MPVRQVQRVSDMEIDEVSMVDRAACPPAAIVFSKRADQEESMAEYTDGDGNPLDLSQFEEGTILEDEDGNQFEVRFDADDADEELHYDDDRELVGAGVSKSAFGASSSTVASIREALSKAVSADDRDRVLSKAVTDLTSRAERAEAAFSGAQEIAKSERDLRLTREYISKAAEYNVPIDAEELGPVLMRMTENMSFEDCGVIHKALSAAGTMLYEEAGFDGTGASEDPMEQVNAFLDSELAKSGSGASREQASTDFFNSNPAAYDALQAERY